MKQLSPLWGTTLYVYWSALNITLALKNDMFFAVHIIYNFYAIETDPLNLPMVSAIS